MTCPGHHSKEVFLQENITEMTVQKAPSTNVPKGGVADRIGRTTKMIPRQKYYAVFKGRSRGIYNNWEQCQPLVYRYKGRLFRSFHTYEAAQYHMNEYLHNKYGVQFCRPLDIVDVNATEEKEVMKTNGQINIQGKFFQCNKHDLKSKEG
ncbi:hypothetical protein EJ110_NYTH40004 [Nymphaea thermarum]|nr:hypothetical protein EJ110_NYTH40004 [Nymphaea thermarum]